MGDYNLDCVNCILFHHKGTEEKKRFDEKTIGQRNRKVGGKAQTEQADGNFISREPKKSHFGYD